ncbi:MAG TPA: hypothetical protein VLA48_03385 [Nitrososphaeraceae archaeon]|nr:hypothetical protein [Nitrososphaeraceae archaeon]
MSSFLSAAYTPTEVSSSFNTNLAAKVLAIKENKYSENKAKVEAQQALFANQLKGLRDSDNEYIAARLQEANQAIESYGNKDYSLTATTDALLGNLKAVYEDPIVRSAVLNRAKYDQVNKEIAEKKKKNDGSYSDKNYQDMLEQAGYYKYLNGETKDLGDLQYSNYIDVTSLNDKKAREYAKERGLKDQYLGSSSTAYETTDRYGVKVTREEIENYLSSSLDEQSKNQLRIDARQSVGKLAEADFTQFMSENQKQENSNISSQIAALTAERDTVSDDKKPQYTEYIQNLQTQLDKGEESYKKGVYDRDDMYNVYTKTKLRSIASNYDVDIITKIDSSDMPFEIMKFKTETELKMQDLALKERANKIAQGASTGTMTEFAPPVEEKQLTKLQETQQATYKTAAALDAYLNENNPDYKKMTPQQQWDYKLRMNPNNPLASGSTTTLKNLVNAFQEAQGGYSKIVKSANKDLTTDTEIAYNSLINGKDLNAENLKMTMPLTASLIKSKRNFNSLSNEEKLGLTTEFTSNYLQYGGDIDEDVRTVYEKVVISNKTTISKYGTDRAKTVNKLLTPATTEEVGGYWSNVANVWGARLGEYVGSPLAAAYRDTTYPFRSLISGEAAADKEYEAAEQAERKRTNYLQAANANYSRMALDSWGGEDTNITELEARDTNNGKDISNIFRTTTGKIKNDIDNIAGTYQENRKTGQAFTFSTADKSQAPTALALRAAVLNADENVAIPAGTNDYTVRRDGAGYTISFISGSGEKAAYTNVSVAKLPPQVAGMYEESVQNWTNNPNNPNIKLTPVDLPAYVSPERRNQDVKNLLKNVELPAEVKNILMTNPANTAFATNSELKDKIKQKYGATFYNTNLPQVDNILNNKYVAVPYVAGNQFFMKIKYVEDGEEKEYNEPKPLGSEKDDHGFYLAYMEAIQKLKSDKINNLYISE